MPVISFELAANLFFHILVGVLVEVGMWLWREVEQGFVGSGGVGGVNCTYY